MNDAPAPHYYSEGTWHTKNTPRGLARSVACIEHLLEAHPPQYKSVLEIGPFDDGLDGKIHKSATAPIKELKARNPNLPCASIGPQSPTDEEQTMVLGDVPFLRGSFSGRDTNVHTQIKETLGVPPSVIYARHVMENSRGGPIYCYQIFEEAMRTLPDDGFLVVDNYMSDFGCVSLERGNPYSARALLHSMYEHDVDTIRGYYGMSDEIVSRCIFVFQRASLDIDPESIVRVTEEAVKSLRLPTD